MKLEGLHHVTAITGDAPANVDFYVGVLGLRMVKKTVNFDAPEVYHLYYGDETGTPGSIMTFFEFPGAARGEAGDGMVHTVLWRVADAAALDAWEARLSTAGAGPVRLSPERLRFTDPEGLAGELVAVDVPDGPLVADAPDLAPEHAIRGFHGVRAYASSPGSSSGLLTALGFERREDGSWVTGAGTPRHAELHYEAPPPGGGRREGAGTVHHVAWSAADDGELEAFRGIVGGAGGRPTPVIDRQYFHSVYFREPSGVLFEIASRNIGFDIDEPLESLGEALKLPEQHEPLRARLEETLTPLPAPRTP